MKCLERQVDGEDVELSALHMLYRPTRCRVVYQCEFCEFKWMTDTNCTLLPAYMLCIIFLCQSHQLALSDGRLSKLITNSALNLRGG